MEWPIYTYFTKPHTCLIALTAFKVLVGCMYTMYLMCVCGFLWGCCGRVGHSSNMECLVHIAYKAYFMRYSLVVTRTHTHTIVFFFWGSIISVTVLADRECIAILIFIAWLYMCVCVCVCMVVNVRPIYVVLKIYHIYRIYILMTQNDNAACFFFVRCLRGLVFSHHLQLMARN